MRNVVIGVFCMSAVGCGCSPSPAPITTRAMSWEEAVEQLKAEKQAERDALNRQTPVPFPVDQFDRDMKDGRSRRAVLKDYEKKAFLIAVKVDKFSSDGEAVGTFAGDRQVRIKLPDSTRKGDTLRVVAVLTTYFAPGEVMLDSDETFYFDFLRTAD